jgi:hypothetical protein
MSLIDSLTPIYSKIYIHVVNELTKNLVNSIREILVIHGQAIRS